MPRQRYDSSIVPFIQHGMVFKGTAGDEAFGLCPFCGNKEHKHGHTFYVNKITNKWQCKSCSREGGYQQFLQQIVEHSKKFFKQQPAIDLSKDRGISLKTLRKVEIGYNPINKTYVIPVPDANRQKLWDVRIYNGKTLRSTSGCKVGLLGWDSLNNGKMVDVVWLCEGEWDGCVMREIISSLDLKNRAVISVPGAGTFKAEWEDYFRNKQVNVVYDKDNAGYEGCRKVYNILKSVTKELRFVHWPQNYKEGFDLRDLYQKNAKNARRTYGFLKTSLASTPPGIADDNDTDINTDVQINVQNFEGPGLAAEEIYTGFTRWLKLPSTDVLDVMFGAVIANRLPGDPLWLFLVAPSGSTKTELLRSISHAPRVVTTTTITVPGLISGANAAGGRDPSLLRIMNDQILVVKDFTTILSMNPLMREEIFGILRDAYDGKVEKRFGNGIFRRYDPCKFGIVAGVTPAIELFTEEHTALGERFLRYRVPLSTDLDEQREILRKAVSNTTHEDRMQTELVKLGRDCLDHNFNVTPKIPDNIIDKILSLSQFTSLMRATIIRDRFSKEITHKPFAELGTRLAKQFCKLLMGIGMFRRIDTVTEDEYQIVKNIALGTIPSRMEEVLRKIYRYNKTGSFDVKLISEMVGLPQPTTGRICENLGMLGILKKNKITDLKNQWMLTDTIHEVIEIADVY